MLFIGGSQDGKNIEVPAKANRWEIANLSKSPISAYAKGAKVPISAPAGTVETYRKIGIVLCEMMVIDYLSVGDVVPRLMGNYRPEVKYDRDTFVNTKRKG